MAKTGGYFLQGFGSGLQTGFNMRMQKKEMDWQEAQQKKLDDKQKKLEDAALNYKSLVTQYGEDNEYTNEEISQLNTTFMALGYEVQQMVKTTHDNIQGMKTYPIAEDMEMLDMWVKWTEDQTPENIAESYEYVKKWVKSEKGKGMFEVAYNLSQKKTEQPEDVWGQAKIVPTDVRAEYLRSKGIDIPEAKVEPTTEMGIMDKNKKILDFAYNTGNPERFNKVAKDLGVDTTFATYKQKYEKPEAVAPEKEDIARTDIAYWEKTFNNVTNEEEYNRQYALLKQSKTSKQYEPKPYKEMLQSEVKSMAKEIKGLLTSDNKFKDDEAKATYAKYQRIYEQKVKELLAKYPDLDISQFPKFLPVEQIKKVGFWKGAFTGGGVAKGDYSVIDTKGW